MIFIDSQVGPEDGRGVLVREVFIGVVEEGYAALLFSVPAGDALAAIGGRTKSDAAGTTPGRPVEHRRGE